MATAAKAYVEDAEKSSNAKAPRTQATTAVVRILCPDPDHVPPCPVPWESRSSIAGHSVTSCSMQRTTRPRRSLPKSVHRASARYGYSRRTVSMASQSTDQL
jgi:hypothetical protein